MSTTTLEVSAAEALSSPASQAHPATYLTTWLSAFEEQTAQAFRQRTKLDYKETIHEIMEAAQPEPGAHVLDMVTGTGVIARQFVGRVGEHGRIVGIDTAAQVEQAKLAALSARVSRKLEWREATPDKLPFEPESFDVVTCAMAFHRLSAETALASAFRILKSGGRLIIADRLAPMKQSPLREFWRSSHARYIQRDQIEADAKFYQAETMVELLRAAGFRQQLVKVLRQRNEHDWAFAVIKAVK